MDKIDYLVIGAGVVGLAVARALALRGREVIVVEQHPAIGMETSSRNSEVIHAGLYYATASLKAQLCVAGRDALYAYCDERAIPYRRCGKLVVATSEHQLPKLHAILQQAHTNKCSEVVALTANQAKSLEPALSCIAALFSPNTGIIDSHAYMLSLQADAEQCGVLFAFTSQFISGCATANGIAVKIRSSDGIETELEARFVINCGGLWAPDIARQIEGLSRDSIPEAHFAKGNYYSLSGKIPFSRLIYPIPDAAGLGVHLTLDLGGQARFGPDVEWLPQTEGEIDYTVDPQRANRFYQAIRCYWPALPDNALQPAYSGIRPKLGGQAIPSADFLFASHGTHHYLGLYGIESPGLTASLAIAEHVATLITEAH